MARVAPSSISSIEGCAPLAMNSATTDAAAASSGKVATAVSGSASSGTRRRVTSTTTPSVPSEPMNSPRRSSPATPLAVRGPRVASDPSASTTFSWRT